MLEAFCEENDADAADAGARPSVRDRARLLRRYPRTSPRMSLCSCCAISMTTGRFGAEDIHAIAIEASGKVVSHHNERAPAEYHAGAIQRARSARRSRPSTIRSIRRCSATGRARSARAGAGEGDQGIGR